MCGAVRYGISEAPIASALCHCNRCRPQSASAFSTVVIIKRSTITLEGEKGGLRGHWLERLARGTPLLPAVRFAAHDRIARAGLRPTRAAIRTRLARGDRLTPRGRRGIPRRPKPSPGQRRLTSLS